MVPTNRQRQKPPRRPEDAALNRVQAAMVSGLPEPTSPEAIAWIREALEQLQSVDPRPDVDLGSIEERLRALEARSVDLEPLWAALGKLADRLNALEDLGPVTVTIDTAAPAVALDPFDPLAWLDLESAKAALLVLITREAARRCGYAIELYEEMVGLDALGDARTPDQDLRLLQHAEWAKERQLVELARLKHNAAIRVLGDLPGARAYDWRNDWPELDR